jgi:dTMP kinase
LESKDGKKRGKSTAKHGKLVVFEGGEGAGKSTQLTAIYSFMKGIDPKTILLREPGGTAISEKIREVILDPANIDMSEKTELLLYVACRAQIVEEKLKPLLKKGHTVLLDRFYLATIVYQGYARGIDRSWIERLNKYSLAGLKEDLTIIYDVSLAEAAKRMKKRVKSDRLDREAKTFHKKVREGYLKEAKKRPNCVVISTDKKSEGEIFDETLSILRKRRVV